LVGVGEVVRWFEGCRAVNRVEGVPGGRLQQAAPVQARASDGREEWRMEPAKSHWQFVDPILGDIAIDPGDAELYEALNRKHIGRLKRIANLGVMSEIFVGATHSKWGHALGTYHLCKSETGLNKDDRALLRGAALLRPLGHVPFAYCGEAAILEAALIEASIRKSVEDYVEPVAEACCRGRKACADDCVQSVFARFRYKELYKWFSARVALGLSSEVLGRDVTRTALTLVCRDEPLHDRLERCSMLDYVQRDVYYSGLGQLRLSDAAEVPSATPGGVGLRGGLAEATAEFLETRMYLHPRVMLLNGLFRKQIVRCLLSGHFAWPSMLIWTDQDLLRKMARLPKRAQVQGPDELARYQPQVLCDIEVQRRRLLVSRRSGRVRIVRGWRGAHEMEKQIANVAGLQIAGYPFEQGILVAPVEQRNGEQRVTLLAFGEQKKVGPALTALSRLADVVPGSQASRGRSGLRAEQRSGWRPIPQDPGLSGLRLIFGGEVTPNWSKVAKVIWRSLRPRQESERKRFLEGLMGEAPDPGARRLSRHLMASVRGDDVSEDYVVERLGESLAWSTHGDAQDLQSVRSVLEELAGWLRGASDSSLGLSTTGSVEETRVFLKLLIEGAGQRRLWRWTYPSVTVTGVISTEIDAVSLRVRGEAVELWLAETTASDSPDKAMADVGKLFGLRNALMGGFKGRFEDLQIVPKVYGAALREVMEEELGIVADEMSQSEEGPGRAGKAGASPARAGERRTAVTPKGAKRVPVRVRRAKRSPKSKRASP